ncbi:MAG: hypothetical protein ACK4UR_04475, partial [Caldimicrobium sp.]
LGAFKARRFDCYAIPFIVSLISLILSIEDTNCSVSLNCSSEEFIRALARFAVSLVFLEISEMATFISSVPCKPSDERLVILFPTSETFSTRPLIFF